MKRTVFIAVTVAVIVATGMVAGCSGGVEEPADQVTVQLKWVHQAQFAGIYAADKKGFYAEENIEVTLRPGGPNMTLDKIITNLISGETAFAIVGGEQVLTARDSGDPIVAIAAIYQRIRGHT